MTAAAALQSLIHAYKRTLSPTLLTTCRFTPTCSDYALEAVERHGAIVGGALALWRVARCNPFVRGGLDMVPAKLPRHHSRIHTCRHKVEMAAAANDLSAGRAGASTAKSPATEHWI